MNDHLRDRSHRRLLSGELPPQESETLLAHLVDCERCLARFESFLRRAGADAPDLALLYPDDATAHRLEAGLFRRVHLASLTDRATWLATHGYLNVVVALVQPLLAGGRNEP